MVNYPEETAIDNLDLPQTASQEGLLQIAWQRKWLIALGAVVGLVGGLLYYAMRPPVYESTAQMLVVSKRPDPLPGGYERPLSNEDSFATHLVIIKSPVVVSQAVQKHDLQLLPSFQGSRSPGKAIMTSLKVGRPTETAGSRNTMILDLSLRAPVAEDCTKILNAVIDSYNDFLDTNYRNFSEETLKLITRARDVTKEELDKKEDEFVKFREENPLLALKGKDGSSVQMDILGDITKRRMVLFLRRREVESRLADIEKALKESNPRARALALAPFMSSRSQSVETGGGTMKTAGSSADDQLIPTLLEELKLLEDYGKDHPQVVAVRNKLKLTCDLIATGLREEVEDIKSLAEPLTVQYEDKYKDVVNLSKAENKEERYRKDIDRAQALFDGILKRLTEIDITKDYGGYNTQIIAPAGTALKVEPKALPTFAVALFIGILAGLGLAYLAEMSDQSFRSPEEIRRRLGLPLIGHIPLLAAPEPGEANGSGLDPTLCAHYHPKSREAESYRGVRTALYFSIHGEGHKVIQITSPDMGDGKTTLAANLAISIAQSGKKVLLVDADLRRPRIDHIFGIPNDLGFTSLLSGEAEPMDAIRPTQVPGLSILPSGPVPPNPAELLTSPRMKDTLDLIRDQFDFVLIDTPPLLAVTDPCAVAPRVDGVLLTIRLAKNGRPHAKRAKEILDALGVKILGVVVNGLSREGKKGYGYGYGAGYGYGYGYKAYGTYGDGNDRYFAAADGDEGGVNNSGGQDGKGRRRLSKVNGRSGSGRGLLGRFLRWW